MFVLTADQRDSLNDPPLGINLVRPFERTVGDEIQAVLADPRAVITATSLLLRDELWSVGIGIGAVDEHLPASTRAGRGPAFITARQAIDLAKKSRPSLIVLNSVMAAANVTADASALLRLLVTVWQRRTIHGWQAIHAMEKNPIGKTQSEVAADLGISSQALSQRLQTALWQQTEDVLPLLLRLLKESDTEGDRNV